MLTALSAPKSYVCRMSPPGNRSHGPGAMPCSVFTRTSQHDTCPLSNQRSASPDSWPYADNRGSSCLGMSEGITAWVGVQGQGWCHTSVLHCPTAQPEIVLAALFRAA